MIVKLSRLLLLTLAIFAAITAFGAVEYKLPTFEMELTLKKSLFTQNAADFRPDVGRASLILDLAQYDTRWERVWGIARNYNVAIHSGFVEAATINDTEIKLNIAMKIETDSWVPGGRAKYEVTLQRAPDGELTGKYKGNFHGVDFEGEATGRVKPKATFLPEYNVLQPGEHPRILFRKSDIPALKLKAETPLGKAAFAAMGSPNMGTFTGSVCGDAIGMGVKYQITGGAKYAEMAKVSCAKHMADRSVGAFARGRQWGGRFEQVAVSYDLCYDAWPVEFRHEVESYLRFTCMQAYQDQKKLGESINWNVGSNYAGPIFAGTAFAGLALWGEHGPAPLKPITPSAANAIAPAVDYTPGAGVPIVPLVPGVSPNKWISIPTIPFVMDADPFAEIGGMEKARPEVGMTLNIDGKPTTFAPLAPEDSLATGGISLKRLQTKVTMTGIYYTVLENDKPRTVKLVCPTTRSGHPVVVLNGNVLENGQVIELQKGRYSLLAILRLGTSWGSFDPMFVDATAEEIAAAGPKLAARQAEYLEEMKDYNYEQAEWKRLDGADVNFLRLFEVSKRMMYLFYREAVGDGGYQTESGHYFEDGIDGPNRYAVGYRTMFGHDLSSFDDIRAFIPRLISARIYDKNGKSWVQNISSSYPPSGKLVAPGFPIALDKYKPAILYHWNAYVGGSVDNPDVNKLVDAAPVQTFLNYPLDMKPQAPGTCLPLNWQATTRGYYNYRNGWKGNDDIVMQINAKTRNPQGWGGPDAGTFRLDGFGSSWAVGNASREVRRYLENVVDTTDGPDLTESGLGVVLNSSNEKDGSGSLSLDLTNLMYDASKPGRPGYETYGDIKIAPTQKPLGSNFRAYAVDYSGKSGAPCLLAIVDRVDGDSNKIWFWQLPVGAQTTADAHGFTLKQGTANLHALFAAPATPKLEAGMLSFKTTKSSGHGAGNTMYMSTRAVSAIGTNPKDGHFFLVATLQQGQAPEITVEGTGLDAKVTVGGRVVSFDGTKIIIADK